MTQLNANPAVAQSLLDRFPLTDTAAVENAISLLYSAIRLSMEQTQAYNLPTDQQLPPEASVDAACTIVHPINIGAVLVALYRAVGSTAPGDLQVYDNGAWKMLAQYEPMVGLTAIIAPPPAPAPAPPPPPPAPAPAPPPPPPAPQAMAAPDLMTLVDSALGTPTSPQAAAPAPQAPSSIAAPETTPATPVAPVRPVIEGEATRVAPQAPQVAAQAAPAAPQQAVDHVYKQSDAGTTLSSGKLPSADVTLPRIASTGRENKSPFTSKVEERKKIAAAPWWQDFWAVSAQKLFTHHPSQALDDSSTGSGPVQAYAALVELQQQVLLGVDPSVTVAELRAFLDEVQNGIAMLPDAAAINQLRDALAGNAK